ncbi:Signal transduction histidine kinase [Methanolobus profundi]|uniref:histidine kinase n=1 Tax=Methanolobus profundi TaxID=487685 RepID=A0A1I4U970_9EURY|nr:Signal transduction histidine kinase [Methanolobus profundi]
MELEFVPGTLDRSLARLDNGSIDIVPAIPFTPEMNERFLLTTEAAFTDWGVVYTYSDSNISSMNDLGGKRIAYYEDIFFESFNASPGNSNISYTFVKGENYQAIFEMIQNRDADAGIIARSYGNEHESQYDVKKISFVISPTDMVFALPKNADMNISILIDENIRQMVIEDGKIHYITPETETTDLNTWESPSWLKFSVSIGGGLLLLLVILSLILRNKVDEKTYELNSKNRELEVEIRERKIAEEKLKQYSLELKHSNELKDLFTDILRHDLINPATVIKGYVEYLMEVETETQKREAASAIERNNKKLIYLIENAANLAKLENMDELDYESLDLKEVIEEVLDNLKPKLDEKKITVSFDQDGGYPAELNATIEDVFSNLIGNSIKYSPSGTTIAIKINDHEDAWEVAITDQGEGIPDTEKPYIFDRFKRAHKVNVKGSGLGLAIVKRIIELHEGSIEVEDGPDGKGTTFKVTLKKEKI